MNRLLSISFALLLVGHAAHAQVPITTSYQGYLELAGTPVTDPSATLTFRLFRTASGGSTLWTETHANVAVADGVFAVALGAQTPLASTLFDGLLFLSVAVGGQGAPQLSPRTVLRASPYARTLTAPARVTGAAPPDGAALRVENTTEGLNSYALHGLSSGASGVTYGVLGEAASLFGIGVYGQATSAIGLNTGVWGYSASDQGTGVFGAATGSASGQTYGVRGLSSSVSGTGVLGHALATNGQTYGVHGLSSSSGGTGVFGQALATSGNGPAIGVRGESASETDAIGVYAEVTATSGSSNYGVYGRVSTPYSTGIHGENAATSGTGHGVYGSSTSPSGAGVYGVNNTNSDNAYGIFGWALAGFAGWFDGDVNVMGTLYGGGRTTQIDHPHEPENRVLRHAAVESPDMKNVYDGVVTLDLDGEAVVVLPSYFEALNRDFRYQLTTIGGYAPVYVAEEVAGNRFRIAGGTPGLRVSWQVTGIRHDAWADANRIVVEEDKKPDDRGRYLHPAAFGQPRERGVDYDPEWEAMLARPAPVPPASHGQ